MTVGERERSFAVTEPGRTPALSIVLGLGPMSVIALGAAGAWLLPDWRAALTELTAFWAGAILLFIAGVRRGLSFRTPGGPTVAQIVTSLGLFAAGFAASLLLLAGGSAAATLASLGLLILGYAGTGVLDPVAARHMEAPAFFARLRPLQAAIAVTALAGLAILVRFG